MKIVSEKTGLEYKTVEECEAAEKAFDEKIQAEKEAREKALIEKKAKEEELAKTRKARATEVEQAYKKLLTANDEYRTLLNRFVKDYGCFHMSLRTGELNPFNNFDFNYLFNTFNF